MRRIAKTEVDVALYRAVVVIALTVISMALWAQPFAKDNRSIDFRGDLIARKGFIAGDSGQAASAIAEFTSTTKGVLLPRMSTAQMLAISSPASGLTVFNADSGKYYYYYDSTWVQMNPQVYSVQSGTYTPDSLDSDNVDSLELLPAVWSRVGDVVTVSGSFKATPVDSNTATAINVSLPFSIGGNFTSNYKASGVLGSYSVEHGFVGSLNGTEQIVIGWLSEDALPQEKEYRYTYQFIIE